jgi:hypothetical protein
MSLLDSAMTQLQNAMSSASSTTQDWSQQWENAKNQLIQKAAEFTQVFNSLQNMSSVAARDPQLSAEYNALMTKGNYIKSTVSSITGSFDTATNWFANQFSALQNYIGMNGISRRVGIGALIRLNGLGVLPLIPIGVILIAVSSIVYWLTDAYTMKQKLDLAAKVQASGGDPGQILNTGTVANITGLSKNVLLIAAIAGVAYVAWPHLKKMKG